MSEFQDNPIEGKGEEMIPQKGLPFSEIEALPPKTAIMSSLSLEELIRFERERAQDFHTPEPAAVRRFPPGWGLETQPPETSDALEDDSFAEAWEWDSDFPISDPDVPAVPPIDIFKLIPDVSAPSNDAILLSRRFDTAMKQVNLQITDFNQARKLGDFLRQANPFLSGTNMDLDKAEHIIEEAEFRVSLAIQKRNWAATDGRKFILYMLIWSALSAAGTATILSPEWQVQLPEPITATFPGALGASIGGLLMIRRLASIRNMNLLRKNFWYYIHPLIGLLLGGAVYYFSLIFLRVPVSTLGVLKDPLPIYVAAFAAGFLFNFIQEIFSKRPKFKF
jgi:hypothetical protein